MVKVYEAPLTDFQPDEHNANLGSERGTYMIRQSLQEVGAGRSLVADKDGVLAAGNKTQEALADLGFEKAIVVETDGTQVVIVKRTDWDLDDPDPNNPARRYAFFDNRSSEVSMTWNPEQIQYDLDAGLDLAAMFRVDELQDIGAIVPEFLPVGIDEQPRLDQKSPVTCPACGHEFVP